MNRKARLAAGFALILLLGTHLPACGDSEPTRVVTGMVKTRDKAVWEATFLNAATLRKALSGYAAMAPDNLYPAGPLGYEGLVSLLPDANLPVSCADAKIAELRYEATPGRDGYTLTVRSTDREGSVITATPGGVEPARYPR